MEKHIVLLATFCALTAFAAKAESVAKPGMSLGARLIETSLTGIQVNQGTSPKTSSPNARPMEANLSFFDKRAEGWHWYEKLPEQCEHCEEQTPKEPPPPQIAAKSLNPTQEIESQRKQLETKLHAAVVTPTHANIMAYLLAQRALMDQSQRFSESWKRVVMTTPSLDETLVHPVDQNARHVYYDLKTKETKSRIAALSKEYGLFYFFREKCAYCHRFAPIVKRFAEKYGWSVLAISLDGEKASSSGAPGAGLLEFPHAKRDNGIGKRLGITSVPALIAVHPKTGKMIPLAYGMISESEIEARAEMLTRLNESQNSGLEPNFPTNRTLENRPSTTQGNTQ